MSADPLKYRRALITGASAGIGEAFAREFAAHDFDLILVARRADKLHQLAEELTGEHDCDVRVIPCDLLDPAAPQELFDACVNIKVDVLVNNAGLMYHGKFAAQGSDSISDILQLNIASLTQLSRLFLAPMLAEGKGRILNITSTTGFQAGPTVAVYAASKAYILSFTEALAEELRGSGVYATAFCPGSTDTHMVASSFGENLRTDPVGSLLMMSSTDVARQGFKACMAGSTVSVPGLANNIITTLGRLQPKWFSRRLQSYMYRKFLDER
jgi:short-subunit dehydrogenase